MTTTATRATGDLAERSVRQRYSAAAAAPEAALCCPVAYDPR